MKGFGMMNGIIAGVLATIAATSAMAAEEPFGPGFEGWKFTQENTSKGILCRAKIGHTVIGRYPDTKMFVSVPAAGITAGTYPDTFFQIGKDSELSLRDRMALASRWSRTPAS